MKNSRCFFGDRCRFRTSFLESIERYRSRRGRAVKGVLFGAESSPGRRSGARQRPLTAALSADAPTRTPPPPCIDRLASENLALRGNDGGIEAPGRLDSSLLGRVVDVNEAEALGVAERPLVVVEQRPREISAQVDPLRYRVVSCAQMLPEVFDAKRIFDTAVDRLRRVVKRGAILGDVDRQLTVTLGNPEQNLGKGLGKNFPVRLGLKRVGLRNVFRVQRKMIGMMPLDLARVIVDPQKIDRLLDLSHVVIRPVRPRLAEDL